MSVYYFTGIARLWNSSVAWGSTETQSTHQPWSPVFWSEGFQECFE